MKQLIIILATFSYIHASQKCGRGSDGETKTTIRTEEDNGTGWIDVSTPSGQPSSCGIRNPNGVGSAVSGNNINEAQYGEFPWMVAILPNIPQRYERSTICGGSLIARDVVLTGAHCLLNVRSSDIKVRAGEWDTEAESETYPYQERHIKKIIIHDDYYSGFLPSSVALIVLNETFNEADHIGTICLPDQGVVFNSKNCFATGWEKNRLGNRGKDILKKIELPTVPRLKCQEDLRNTRLGGEFVLSPWLMCAGGEGGMHGGIVRIKKPTSFKVISTDGGGSLVCPDPSNPNRYLQAGTATWSTGHAPRDVPGVYVDVAQFRGWIDEQMATHKCAPSGQPSSCGIRNPNGVGSTVSGNNINEAQYGEFPWMVAILTNSPERNERSTICGGSLIARDVVLTGAHCVRNVRNSDIKVRAGEWDTEAESETYPYQERHIKKIIIHDDYYSGFLPSSVALIVLNETFNEADHIGTICLPDQGVVFNSKNCFATGWEKNRLGNRGKEILKKIELPTVPRLKCQENLRNTRLGGEFVLSSWFMCAGGESGIHASIADGGGSLVCPNPSNPQRYLQAGTATWSTGHAPRDVSGLYVDVAQFRGWIDEQMAKHKL